MAENLKPYHVPQQNRRNKLRFTTTTHQTNQQQQEPSSNIFQTNLTSFLQLNPPKIPPPPSSLQVPHQPNFNTPFNPFPLNLHAQAAQQYDATVSGFADSFKQQKAEVRSSVPFGPFTGYASILKRSRFLKPAQQILDELCGTLYFDSSRSQVDSFSENSVVRDSIAFGEKIERSRKTSKLVLMLEEVYWKYKLYCQQMQSVIASFETVAGLGHVAPYASFAFKAISKQFCCLKNCILDQIQVSGKTLSDINANNEAAEQGIYSQKPVQKLGFLRPPHWRSQRALPDHAVAVLKTWLYENFLHPYPTDSDKQILAQKTGLLKNQVSNWFINARVRLWKPMVEEIHMLETGKTQTRAEAINPDFNMPSDHLNTLFAEKLPQASQSLQIEHVPTKCRKKKLAQIPEQSDEEQKKASLTTLPSDQQIGIGGGSGVSLALALKQNDGNDLSRPFPVTIPRRIDLELEAETDMETGSVVQNQHLG